MYAANRKLAVIKLLSDFPSLCSWNKHTGNRLPLELLQERTRAFAAEYFSFLCTIRALLHTYTPNSFSETRRDPPSVCNKLYPLLSFQCLP